MHRSSGTRRCGASSCEHKEADGARGEIHHYAQVLKIIRKFSLRKYFFAAEMLPKSR